MSAVPEGYKQTEVGVIPKDWAVPNIESVLSEISMGPFGSDIKVSNFVSEGIPVLSGANVRSERLEDLFTNFVTPAKAKALKKAVARRGDIVVTHRGTLGQISYIPDDSAFDSYVISQSQFRARFNPNLVTPNWVTLYFLSVQGAAKLLEGKGHTGVPALAQATTKFRQLRIPLPLLPEQRAIATALSDVDALLAKLDQFITKKRDLKQAAMQQLLTGQTRLPGFSGEWEVRTLFDLAERRKDLFDDGDWIESEHITTEGIRLVQTGNIGIGCFVEKDAKKFIYEKSFTTLRCKQLKTGDLLVCRLADPAGRACVLPDIGEERIVTSVDVTIFRPPVAVVDRVYLANVFSTPDWFRAVSDRSGGTTHKRISRGALGRISIKLPPIPEQSAIATVLSDMDAELAALETRRDKTRALKQGMMQELLTGRIRLA